MAEEEGLKSIRDDYETLSNLFSQITVNYEERQKYIQEGAMKKDKNIFKRELLRRRLTLLLG